MITPTEIKKKAENKYTYYLRSIIEDETFFPIVIVGNKKPSDDTVQFEKELTDLIGASKEKKGYGYSVEYQKVKTKKHGEQDIPMSISFSTETDYLKFIGKETTTINFRDDAKKILSQFSILKEWVCQYPQKVLEYHEEWSDLLRVCDYFERNPMPGLYIRELPINVHTKFIEIHKSIIKELLEIIIGKYVNTAETRFEARFNLKYDEPIIRFRILDKDICKKCFWNIEDISIPITQFKTIEIPVDTVYVVENKINMLTFPKINNSMVLWGHGFGVDILKEVEWMNAKKIYYWGDLDAHGFQILSEFRTHFSEVESFLMDRGTFDRYFEGNMGSETKVEKDLHLTQEEKSMFIFLKENNYRLEQEKIPYEYALARIPRLK